MNWTWKWKVWTKLALLLYITAIPINVLACEVKPTPDPSAQQILPL